MAATTRCRFCGATIVLTAEGADSDVIAVGDQIVHRGCVEVAPEEPGPSGPAYFIPRNW